MITMHWTILFCAIGVGLIIGFATASILANSGMAARCEECPLNKDAHLGIGS
jgi:hypothetical protein